MSTRIIFLLFELMVFLLLTIQLVQLSSQFLLPALRKQIRNIKKQWQDLKDKLALSRKTKKRLKEKISAQEESFKILEQKIKVWHARSLEKQAAIDKRQAEHTTKIQAKKKLQLEKAAIYKAHQEVLPRALEQARKTLKKEYGGEKGAKLLQNVIKDMGGS